MQLAMLNSATTVDESQALLMYRKIMGFTGSRHLDETVKAELKKEAEP